MHYLEINRNQGIFLKIVPKKLEYQTFISTKFKDHIKTSQNYLN